MPKFNDPKYDGAAPIDGTETLLAQQAGLPLAIKRYSFAAIKTWIMGFVGTVLSGHVGAADPHMQYVLESELPAGPQGPTGPAGSDGAPGPNQVSTATATTLTGILKGDGSTVSAAAAGDFPTLNQNTSGTAANITAYPLDQSVSTTATPTFSKLGIGAISPQSNMEIYASLSSSNTNPQGLRVSRSSLPSQFISINESDGGQHRIQAIGEKPLNIENRGTTQGIVLSTNNATKLWGFTATGDMTTPNNVGIGQTAFGTSATKTLAVATGTAPTTSPADAVQLYSADISGVAGKAGLHVRNEDGTVIKLSQADAIANATDAASAITQLNLLLTALRNAGLIAP